METINAAGFSKMTNTYHVSFHASVLALIDERKAKEIGVSDEIYDQYKNAILQEQDIVCRTTASDKTGAIRNADAERDRLFRYVRNVLANVEFSSDAALKEAFQVIKTKILDNYPISIVWEGDQKESALIRGFILDLNNFVPEQVKSLGLTEAVAELEAANEAYQAAFLGRINEQCVSELGYSQTCRKRCDDLYMRISSIVNYHASKVDATEEADVKLCATATNFVQAVNVLIRRIRQAIRLGKSLSETEEGNGGQNQGGNGGSNSGGNNGGNNSGGNSGGGNNGGSNQGVNLD